MKRNTHWSVVVSSLAISFLVGLGISFLPGRQQTAAAALMCTGGSCTATMSLIVHDSINPCSAYCGATTLAPEAPVWSGPSDGACNSNCTTTTQCSFDPHSQNSGTWDAWVQMSCEAEFCFRSYNLTSCDGLNPGIVSSRNCSKTLITDPGHPFYNWYHSYWDGPKVLGCGLYWAVSLVYVDPECEGSDAEQKVYTVKMCCSSCP